VSRYFLDTEFIEDGTTIDLISIGVVCDDGREFYAEAADVDWSKADQWVLDNVKPHLLGGPCVMDRKQIAADLVEWVAQGDKPEFWGYYADCDWVVLCRQYGRMIDLPDGWPMFCMDIKQLAVSLGDPKLPEQTSTEHNALEDARWNQVAWTFLQSRER
jgi:hypothetical protein